MAQYIATYEFELNEGNIPELAMAEYLQYADQHKSDWNVWEITNGDMTLISIKPKE